METILMEGSGMLGYFQEGVFQPQSDIPHFRRFLSRTGWEIRDEKMICEEGKYYPMMRAVPFHKTSGARPDSSGNEGLYSLEELFGKVLLKKKDPVLRSFLDREETLCARVEESLWHAKSARGKRKSEEIRRYREMVRQAMELMK